MRGADFRERVDAAGREVAATALVENLFRSVDRARMRQAAALSSGPIWPIARSVPPQACRAAELSTGDSDRLTPFPGRTCLSRRWARRTNSCAARIVTQLFTPAEAIRARERRPGRAGCFWTHDCYRRFTVRHLSSRTNRANEIRRHGLDARMRDSNFTVQLRAVVDVRVAAHLRVVVDLRVSGDLCVAAHLSVVVDLSVAGLCVAVHLGLTDDLGTSHGAAQGAEDTQVIVSAMTSHAPAAASSQ